MEVVRYREVPGVGYSVWIWGTYGGMYPGTRSVHTGIPPSPTPLRTPVLPGLRGSHYRGSCIS